MTYYISPRFLDKLAVHITKNFINLPDVRVPLILGIHGRKGEGKSFQCELVFQKMGIEPVRMSAGELESPDAGDPVRLIRMRYREAAELIKVRGKMCALLINDLDAGAGRVDKTTQYTVNTQLVNGTLMNIADNPTDVQLPGSYETQPIHRVPIIVTGNDFSTLYAPLVRDGRMEKFYWEPSREDREGIVSGIFAPDGLSSREVSQLVETFANQSIDFFGALRSRIYDEQIRHFINQVGLEKVSTHLVNHPGQQLQIDRASLTLNRLIEMGEHMVAEQQRIHSTRLAEEYVGGVVSPVPTATPSRESSQSGSPSIQSDYSGNGGQTQLVQQSPAPSSYVQDRQPAPVVTGFPAHVAVDKIERVLEQAIQQGSRLSLEVAKPREKAGNIWRSWRWSQPPVNATKALESLRECLEQNPGSFVKLIGYNSQTQTRLLEELIVRPQ